MKYKIGQKLNTRAQIIEAMIEGHTLKANDTYIFYQESTDSFIWVYDDEVEDYLDLHQIDASDPWEVVEKIKSQEEKFNEKTLTELFNELADMSCDDSQPYIRAIGEKINYHLLNKS